MIEMERAFYVSIGIVGSGSKSPGRHDRVAPEETSKMILVRLDI
jgi:hypothetical protein